jgi:hypothetical protein
MLGNAFARSRVAFEKAAGSHTGCFNYPAMTECFHLFARNRPKPAPETF